MRKFWIMAAFCVVVGRLSAAMVWADEQQEAQYMALLRADLLAEKAKIVVNNMHFTEAEKDAFWPVYQQYQKELGKLGNEKVALIKDYAAHFETVDDAKAKELTTRVMALEEQRLQIIKKYIDEFSKVLPAKQVARFFQLELLMQRMIDLQVSESLPLIH